MVRKNTTKTKSSKNKETVITVLPEPAIEEITLSDEVRKDPRKSAFLLYYYDRESPTYGNARQSALRAGFTETYANNITFLKPQWLLDFIGNLQSAKLAEAHLNEVLSLPIITQAMGAFGPITRTETIKVEKKLKNGSIKFINKKVKVPVLIPNVSVIKEKTAAAKIILPAHDPKYKNGTPTNPTAFIFNMQNIREEYSN